jgi:hypothetical protein
MKNTCNFFLLWVLCSCGGGPIQDSYVLQAPEPPALWREVLGEPSWRFEWVNEAGETENADSALASRGGVEILQSCITPVFAFPYWPKKGIPVGMMKPAGALFPFDRQGGAVLLSFEGGVDAVFYRELAALPNGKRLPRHFDWQRFRALREEKKLDDELRNDLWLADWKLIAEKTAASGFSARRIKARETENLIIHAPAGGLWISASPFMKAYFWSEGETVALQVSAQVDSYFSARGTLRLTRKMQSWIPN